MFLEINNLSFAYSTGDKPVLQNISWAMKRGETVVVLGSSGSGKSTLLKLISGIEQEVDLTTGNISIQGLKPKQYIEQGSLSFMFQNNALLPNLTVQKNIMFPGVSLDENLEQNSQELMEMVGLVEKSSVLPKDLSEGMKSRVSLARSFITEPKLLLMDEPFASLDIAWRNILYKELDILKKKHNTSVVLVSHDVGEALILADRIICLGTAGNIIFETQNTRLPSLREKIESVIIQDHNQTYFYEK